MKRVIGGIALALLCSTGAYADGWSSTAREDGQTQFFVNLKGEVPQRCRMHTKQEKTLELDVENTNAKTSDFKFNAWCNNDNAKGLLVVGAQAFKNENGVDVIPLKVAFNGESAVIDGTTNASNSHAIETSMDVSNSTEGYLSETKTLNITPVINGWEKAGEYKTSMYVSLYPR
ncbi:hypothetical protein [Enterovibrio nigricans]|uniref:Pilin (Type 1 fimbria component protein) n=1 Tax=Enterovibrio nigricans DSM 22720 TaxID=1121868 RepID=A0A1T4TRZ0_9GAMM|nr:hypothetical protein [Enterovibrio nigricans]PKF49014.1 hypothetical protein AT251_21970 [Enterovibrio nigricans]SKA43202.1 hypothetical protein SAMN02745132_00003 [Enterovibrio nigricans DSM 22720]